MNFEQSIYPLTEFLAGNNFSVTQQGQHFIEYCSKSAIITITYSNLEHLFYPHIGQDPESLVELTPTLMKEFFKDDRFQLQSTLTIENLISIFKTSGKLIVLGDKQTFNKLSEFSERLSREYARQILHLQNIQMADKAWNQKDFSIFINCIDKTEKDLLPMSYSKKYKIAMDKLRRQTK